MTRSTSLVRLGLVAAFAGAAIAACGGSGTSSSSAGAPTTGASMAANSSAPSMSPSSAPSMSAGAESPSMSAGAESPSSAAGLASPSSSVAPSFAPSGAPAVRTVQVQAFEGGFMNPPVDPVPGTILTFRNVGKEAHEMVVVRRNDNATTKQVFDNPTKLNPADLMKFVTVVGVLAADPGQESTGQIVLTEAGDYLIVDLLAKGTATAPASPDPLALPTGLPNLATGLFATFTVQAPTAS